MTVWITGMAGFIGQAAARAAARLDRKTAGIGLIAGPVPQDILPRVVVERIEDKGLSILLERHGPPSAVVHAAGSGSVGVSLADPAMDFDSNVLTTQNLCEFLRVKGIAAPLVLVSSAAVYGAEHSGAIAETAPPAPVSPYGFNKYAAELVVRSYGANFGQRAAIVRLFSVYGEGLRKQIFWDLCTKLARAGETALSGDGTESRDFIHVDDAARALFVAAEFADARAPVLNVGTGIGTPMQAVAETVCQAWKDVRGTPARVDFSGIVRAGDPASLVADTSLLRRHGYAPSIDFTAGVRRYVAWFSKNSATPA